MDRNTLVNEVIIDRSPQATDSILEETTNPSPRSPGTQKCDIQEINEENRQTHKIYHFHNCGTVTLNMDSYNARGVRMENCGNKVPQVTICHRVSGNEKGDENLYPQLSAVASQADGSQISTEHPPHNGMDYVILFSASLLVNSFLMILFVNLPHFCDVGGTNAGGLL